MTDFANDPIQRQRVAAARAEQLTKQQMEAQRLQVQQQVQAQQSQSQQSRQQLLHQQKELAQQAEEAKRDLTQKQEELLKRQQELSEQLMRQQLNAPINISADGHEYNYVPVSHGSPVFHAAASHLYHGSMASSATMAQRPKST